MQKIINFLKSLSEFSTIVVALMLFLVSPALLRMIDPDAGDVPVVVIQRTIYFIFQIFMMHGVLWILWKLTWKDIARYFDNDFCNDFNSNSLTKWQRLKLSCFLWFSYLVFVGLIVMGGVMN